MFETEIPIPGTLEGLGDLGVGTEGFLDFEHRDRDGTPSDHLFPQTSLDTIQKTATAVSQSCRLNYPSGVTPYQPTRPGLSWSQMKMIAVFVEGINSSKWGPSCEGASNEVQMPDENRGYTEVLQNGPGLVHQGKEIGHDAQKVHYSPKITYKPSSAKGQDAQESRRRKILARKRTKLGLDQVNLFPYLPKTSVGLIV